MPPIPAKAQFALIGIIFHPHRENPWLVQDNRKALKNECACRTKTEVLQAIANILDGMDQSSNGKEPPQ
jgi:hypothetical protein